jgi:hypothetical protein
VVGGTVEIDAADFVLGLVERGGDVGNDRFDGENALRAAEATESCVRDGVSLAGQAYNFDVRQPVGIISVAERAGEDGAGEIGNVAAFQGNFHVEREDAAFVVIAGGEFCGHVVALAGEDHVDVTRQAQTDGSARFMGADCGHAGDERGLAFLAAEGTAHTADFNGDRGERSA